MLQHFFEIALKSPQGEEIFKKLKIGKVDKGKYMELYGTFRVIFLDFKNISPTYFYESFKSMISELFKINDDILQILEDKLKETSNNIKQKELTKNISVFNIFLDSQSSNFQLETSLEFLSCLISEFCKEELIILIDEIDYPIMDMISSHTEIITTNKITSEMQSKRNEIIDFMSFLINFLSGVCKPSPKIKNIRIKSIIMTGITNTLTESSKLNNLEKLNMMSEVFQKYFGVEESDLHLIIAEIFEMISEKTKDELLSKLKKWYNGYYFPSENLNLFNVWSIMNYFKGYLLKNEKNDLIEPKSFWASSDSSIVLGILPQIIKAQGNSDLMNYLKLLADEKEVPKNFYDYNSNNLYDFLKKNTDFHKIYAYLLISNGYVSQAENGFKVPNYEILNEFKKVVIPNYLSFEMNIEQLDLNNFCRHLNESLNNDEIFEKLTNEILKKIKGEKNEAFFQSLISGLIGARVIISGEDDAHYYCCNETTVEGGRIDSYFLPTKKNAQKTFIIHENKILHKMRMGDDEYTLDNAIWQAFCKNYVSEPLSKYDQNSNSTW